jgi:hypothetical protein
MGALRWRLAVRGPSVTADGRSGLLARRQQRYDRIEDPVVTGQPVRAGLHRVHRPAALHAAALGFFVLAGRRIVAGLSGSLKG